MFICDHWFHVVFTRQSSGRKRKILEKLKKYIQKNFYVRMTSKIKSNAMASSTK